MSTYPPEKAGVPGSRSLPTRTTGGSVNQGAVPDAAPSDTTGLLLERLQAWKHACGYLEKYVTATEKLQNAHAKEYEHVLKSISDPLREGHHFDQALGGVAGLFENMRANTQAIAVSHTETSKSLQGSVLPILTRLHTEIKSKHSEIEKGAGKSAKAVDTARNTTQKHIELLGQHTASFDSAGGKVESQNDPYVLQRGILHRVHKQTLEENNNREDLIAVQQNFQAFEGHVIETIQQAMTAFLQHIGGQEDRQKAMYSDMVGSAQHIPLDFEWNKFIQRSGNLLVDPAGPKREVSHISYPNQDHASTKPLIAGTLERKGRGVGALSGYKTGYYVITPAKYLHQFADDDNFRKEPTPELSLYLPDCTIGAAVDTKFNVKGKNSSHGKIGGAFSMAHELAFKAHTPADAQKWHEVIAQCTSSRTSDLPDSTVTSPISPVAHSGPPAYVEKHPAPLQTSNIGQAQSPTTARSQDVPMSTTSAAPASAGQTSGTIATPTTPATAHVQSPGASALGK